MKFQYIFTLLLCSLVLISVGWWGSDQYKNYIENRNNLPILDKFKPLEKYTIENLSKTDIKSVKVTIGKTLQETERYTSNEFEFKFDPTLQYKNENKNKKVTGLINMPIKSSLSPMVLLIRGYVDQSIYTTGTGSKRVGEYLAENGYITVAPDFLGYAGSDQESGNIFETRFQTYTTVLTLLKSVNQDNFPQWDGKNIFIWAHSNGGQIALTTLEISKVKYPTVLWAPVTKPFPYSILYYTDESIDGGKYIRKELSKFEENYDVDKYSLTKYLDKIEAPIQFHIGTNDDAIPLEWSDGFVKQMKSLNKEILYYKHQGADHNMNPLWNDAIKQTLEFYASKIVQ